MKEKQVIYLEVPNPAAQFIAVLHHEQLGLVPVEAPDLETFLARLLIRGHEATGEIESNPRLRPELRGWPKFTGLVGPCWGGTKDGQPVIRYESQAAYRILSS